MNSWLTYSFLAWLLLNPLLAVAQIAVNFQDNVVVVGPRIVLADIAVIKPAGPEAEEIGQLPVAAAPAPGKAKELSTVTVINSLRNRPEVTDVDWQGSQSIVVQRQANTLGQEQLHQIITAYLKENSARLPNTELRFTAIRAPKELTVPAGQLSWKVTPSRPGIIGSTSFSIALFADGKPAGNCIVRGRLEALAEVATAAANLHKGDVVTDGSIVMQRQDIAGRGLPFMTKEPLLGMQVARTVTAGTILTKEHIVLPPVVKSGEMVKIFARKGALQLSASGIARTDGRPGEIISVKNIGSNKMIHCRVDGPGLVSVEL